MKNMKWFAVLMVAILMVLSGCTKSSTNTPNSPTPSDKPADPGQKASEPLILNWMTFVPSTEDVLPPADKDNIRKVIEEKFNVKLNLEYGVFGEEFNTKLSLKMTSGDTPDMFHADAAKVGQFIMDDALADLTPYVTPETMPNYYKWVTQDQIERYQVEDVFKRAPVPYEKEQYVSYYVRKDWLDNLNLKVPTNYDEMLNVMKAFTFNDPDGNNKNDTYGFTVVGNGNSVPLSFPEWAKEGLNVGLIYDQENGAFVDPSSDIRAGKVLDNIKATLALKVVDPDWFLAKPGQDIEKVVSGKVGIFFSNSRTIAFDDAPNSVKKQTIELTGVQTADFVPFHMTPNAVSYEALPSTPFLFGAKTSPEKIKRTIEILDWLASPEGYLLSHYGKEGVNYTKNGGTITIIPDALTKENAENGNYFDIYGSIFAFGVVDPSPIGLTVIDPRETDHDRAILDILKSYKYPLFGTNVSPPKGYDIGAFRTKMREYLVKILFEEKDASNWPKYRQELMTTYHGKEIFDNYASILAKAFNKPVVFKADN